MNDTTPVTTAIATLIRTGTTEQQIVAAVAHLFPNLTPQGDSSPQRRTPWRPHGGVSTISYRVVVRQSTARFASHKPHVTAVKNSAHVTSPGCFGNTSGTGCKA
jgi:hypothetical protein